MLAGHVVSLQFQADNAGARLWASQNGEISEIHPAGKNTGD